MHIDLYQAGLKTKFRPFSYFFTAPRESSKFDISGNKNNNNKIIKINKKNKTNKKIKIEKIKNIYIGIFL